MRGDYYVVPPNSARVEVCVPEVLGSARAPGPEVSKVCVLACIGALGGPMHCKLSMNLHQLKENYLLAIPLLRTENFHVVDLAQPSKDVCLHLKEYSLYRMFQIQDLLQLSILGK